MRRVAFRIAFAGAHCGQFGVAAVAPHRCLRATPPPSASPRHEKRITALVKGAKTATKLPDVEPTSPQTNRFYVDPARLAKNLSDCIGNSRHVYVKGGVHDGKTSLALTLSQTDKGTCYVSCQDCVVVDKSDAVDVAATERKIVEALRRKWSFVKRLSDVQGILPGNRIIFDECHRLFIVPEASSLHSYFIKRDQLKADAVYMSTTSVGVSASGVVTPHQITNKWWLPWRYTAEEVEQLMVCIHAKKLVRTYTVDPTVAPIIHGFLRGHRGMTNLLLASHEGELNFRDVVKQIGKMLRTGSGFLESRSVWINGNTAYKFPLDPTQYSDSLRTLLKSAVAQGGVVSDAAVKAAPHDLARCTTLGAVEPGIWAAQTTIPTQLPKDPIGSTSMQQFSVGNPFLLRKLAHVLDVQCLRVVQQPTTPMDAVVNGLSHFSYEAMFASADELLGASVWYEDPLNDAVRTGIKMAFPQADVQGPPKKTRGGDGQPDIRVNNLVVEGAVFRSAKEVNEHYNRFWDPQKALYARAQASGHGALLVYCSRAQLPAASELIKSIVKQAVPIAILCVDFSDLWQFDLHVYWSSVAHSVYTIPADLTCWRLSSTNELERASRLAPELQAELDALQRTSTSPVNAPIYCRVELPDKTTVSTDVAATLRKEDLPRTVDGLKKALLREFERDAAFLGKSVRHLKVYPPGKERATEQYAKMSTPLAAAPEEAPYHVVVS